MEKNCKRIRREILTTIYKAQSGHPGGSLSGVELLYVLYHKIAAFNPNNPLDDDRDRIIFSKGHASPLAYVILSEFGFFPKSELEHFREFGARLQGHVYTDVPGIELSTGSLGQGLSFACGIALAGQLKKKDYKIYCYLGDGELQEGNVWEAFMTAGSRDLKNICAIIDYNKVQENGFVKDIKTLDPLKDRLESFGWEVVEIEGHNIEEIQCAYTKFLTRETYKPFAIVANTVKGKGVSFMEFNSAWHGKAPNNKELEMALQELGE